MRTAFYGGTFDPPHLGHLDLAREASEQLNLDRVVFAPVAVQPLKPDGAQASFADRMAMVRIAAAGDSRLTVSNADGPRPDGLPNYTLDTLIKFRASLPESSRLFFLTGADALYSLRRWQNPAKLLLLCDWILAARSEFPFEQIADLLPGGILVKGRRREAQCTTLELAGPADEQSHFYLLTGFHSDISATEIRRSFARGEEPRSILPPGVLEYIHKHNLYQSGR